jgi:EAL domain-containing protein (putative c-di-GMP-specific phosphodiesterase class I)
MQGMEVVLDKLSRLNALGIKLAIDDFGTGYSSLSYLKQFPLYRLKIDQSFTAGLPENRESLAITQAIVHMGHSLGLNILAEGIETEDQESQLRSMACNAGQGYLYAKPLSPDDVKAFVLAR